MEAVVPPEEEGDMHMTEKLTLKALAGRIESLGVKDNTKDIERLDEAITAVREANNETTETMTTGLREVEAGVQGLHDTTEELRGRFEEIATRIMDSEEADKELQKKLTELAKSINQTDSRINSVNTKIEEIKDQHETSIRGMKGRVDELWKEHVLMMVMLGIIVGVSLVTLGLSIL